MDLRGENSSLNWYKDQLQDEREMRRQLTEEYEKEANYLKHCLAKVQTDSEVPHTLPSALESATMDLSEEIERELSSAV